MWGVLNILEQGQDYLKKNREVCILADTGVNIPGGFYLTAIPTNHYFERGSICLVFLFFHSVY